MTVANHLGFRNCGCDVHIRRRCAPRSTNGIRPGTGMLVGQIEVHSRTLPIRPKGKENP